jgi:methylenetetrahydrofolate dehydrogenase (NADP+)/methenyltetrahydrofolate cyclohydrolase
MAAELIDGKEIARQVREDVAKKTEAFTRRTGMTPGLAAVLVGDDPASKVYVGHKKKACAQAGLYAPDLDLPGDTSEDLLIAKIKKLNDDDSVHGILIQLPLPPHIDSARVQRTVDPRKDVDCFHPENVGCFYLGNARFIPCTPRGCMELLDRTGIELKGKRAVVVGRSNIVGKPMAFLLLSRHATVTMCHSRTVDLPGVCREADVLVAAIGRGRFINADFVKPGAVVIDVGMNSLEENGKRKLYGDVDFESVSEVASHITPVPGGVGPMTIAMLLKNTIEAAETIVP